MKKFLSLLTVLVLTLSMTVTVFAEGIDYKHVNKEQWTKDCSLELTCKYDRKAVAGVELTVYKVANAVTFNSALDGSGTNYIYYYGDNSDRIYDFDDMTAIKCNEYAKKLDVKKLEKVATATSDKNGAVKFNFKEQGMYVVVQTGAKDAAKDYSQYDPFLISLPTIIDNEIILDIKAAPKTFITENEKDKNYPPDGDDNIPPHTGDVVKIPLLISLLVISVFGIYVSSRKKKLDKIEE